MNKLTMMAVILITGVLLISGCSNIKEYSWIKPASPGTPTEQNIESIVGSQFIISAESNVTTGYIWEASFDQSYVNLVSSEYVVDNPGLVGSGGKDRFVFQSLKSGETKIVLTYKRPWEQQAGETVTFVVQIR
jgi:predicted secreted protein